MEILAIIGAITGVVGMLTGVASVLVTVYVVKWQARWQTDQNKLQSKELERTNRLMFLSDRIFDITIPRDLRLPFYEEYISMKGNGTAVKFWLIEGQKEQAALSKSEK